LFLSSLNKNYYNIYLNQDMAYLMDIHQHISMLLFLFLDLYIYIIHMFVSNRIIHHLRKTNILHILIYIIYFQQNCIFLDYIHQHINISHYMNFLDYDRYILPIILNIHVMNLSLYNISQYHISLYKY